MMDGAGLFPKPHGPWSSGTPSMACREIRKSSENHRFRPLSNGEFRKISCNWRQAPDPDVCRLWDLKTGEKMDKDRFRRDLGNVMEAYEEVLGRVKENLS